jgi:hypothetical protein
MIKECKQKWWQEMATEIETDALKNNTRNMYQKLKLLQRSPGTKSDTLRDIHGNVLKSVPEKLERWHNYFEQLLNSDKSVIQSTLDSILPPVSDANVHQIPDDPPTIAEVESAVNQMANNKCPGDDRIMAELLKNSGQSGIVWLH